MTESSGPEIVSLPPRGILKRRRVQLVPGTRFRCYSESTASDQDWVARRLGSPGAKSRDEGGAPCRKTVRFSEKVHQQLYRDPVSSFIYIFKLGI